MKRIHCEIVDENPKEEMFQTGELVFTSDRSRIVLVEKIDEIEKSFSGSLVYTDNELAIPVGHYSKNWSVDKFKKLDPKIFVKLQNRE